jgi:dihydrofolate synthase/folylpolyglutamate synthase
MATSYEARLAAYARFGIHLSLERINKLLDNLGNPHLHLSIVHVAGTNGKGSVCAFVSRILAEAGYRVGRYISPHLVDWRERITINGEWISRDDLEQYLTLVERSIDPDLMPTQFEVLTAVAWLYFARQKVDIAVIETGLGGRLDATNVHPQPLVTVITSISWDHWQRLGNSLAQIAAEKAGIIKPNRPLILGEITDRSAESAIIDRANRLQAPITRVSRAQTSPEGLIWQNWHYRSSLQGEHQKMNSALALAVIQELLAQGWPIPDRAVLVGLAHTQWQGRLQWYEYGGKQILLDGAHNPAAAEYLRQFIDEYYGIQPVQWLMGILRTKPAPQMLQILLRPQDSLIAVGIPDHDAYTTPELAGWAKPLLQTQPLVYPSIREVNFSAVDRLVICGSLYLVGSFLQLSSVPLIDHKFSGS